MIWFVSRKAREARPKLEQELFGLDSSEAVIAQLGERQTEDLEVLGSIPSPGIFWAFSKHRITAEHNNNNIIELRAGLWRSW